MAKRRYPLAARAPFGVEAQYRLTERLHHSLQDQQQEMVRIAEQAKIAQDASAAIYVYAVAKADATLCLADLIKSVGSPWRSAPELEALHNALRAEYLANVQKIASQGAQKVLDALSR